MPLHNRQFNCYELNLIANALQSIKQMRPFSSCEVFAATVQSFKIIQFFLKPQLNHRIFTTHPEKFKSILFFTQHNTKIHP